MNVEFVKIGELDLFEYYDDVKYITNVLEQWNYLKKLVKKTLNYDDDFEVVNNNIGHKLSIYGKNEVNQASIFQKMQEQYGYLDENIEKLKDEKTKVVVDESEGEDPNKKLLLMLSGKCPYCKAKIKNWKPVFGSFAPEWWATMREKGIDPSTGHKVSCKNKEIKL